MQRTNSAAIATLNWSFFVLVIFYIAAYLPLIINGGIIVDDWGDIAHNLDCDGFIHCYQSWFPLFSNRPLAPLPITVSTFIFGTFFPGYLILNTVTYLLAIFLTQRVISQLVGNGPSIVFAVFAAIPFIAMPVIASPINQLTATVSFLLWALSLNELNNFVRSSHKKSYVLTYIYLLLAFLTYEVILPLLVFTALLPFIINVDTLRKNWFNYFIRFVLPIGAVLAIIVLWQKGIAPQFMEVDSRLKLNPQQMLAKLHTWGHVFFAQIPSLFIKSLTYVQPSHFLLSALFILALFLGFFKNQTSKKTSEVFRFLIVSALCFLASSSIFILSNESANSWGYQARGLSSTWFSLSILLGALSSLVVLRKVIILPLITALGVMSTLSFVIQRDNYIQSSKTQMIIISNVLDLIHQKNIPNNSVVIGDVPKFLIPNYNDEIIFSQPWDFGGALALFSNGKVKDGAVIDSKRQDFNRLLIKNNDIEINGWWKIGVDKLWLYEFDYDQQKGVLSKIESINSFSEKMHALGYKATP